MSDELATIELDLIQVKGKTVGLHVYALMGDATLKDDPDFQAMKGAVDGMIAAYRSQEWARAHELIAHVRELGQDFNLDILCDLSEGRVKAYEIEPPPPIVEEVIDVPQLKRYRVRSINATYIEDGEGGLIMQYKSRIPPPE